MSVLLIWVLLAWLLLISATVTVIYKQNQAYTRLQASSGLLRQLSDISDSVALAAPSNSTPARLRQLDQQFQGVVHLLREGGMVDGVMLLPLDKPLLGLVSQLVNEWQRRLMRLDFSVSVEQVLLPATSLNAEDSLFRHNTQQLLDAFDAARESTRAQYRWTVFFMLSLDLVALCLFYFMLRAWAADPLRQLMAQGYAFANGNYRAKSTSSGTSETCHLSQVLNACGLKIQQLDAQLSIEQRHLSQLNAIYRSLSHNPLLGVYVSRDGRFDFVNKKLAETLGYSRSQLRQEFTVDQVFLAPRFPSLTQTVPDSRSGGSSLRYETRALRYDGKSIDVEICAIPIQLDGSMAVVAVVQDITTRVRNEVTGRLAAVVYENTCEAIVVTDRFGHVVDANPAFSRITGYGLDEVRGRTLSILNSQRPVRMVAVRCKRPLARNAPAIAIRPCRALRLGKNGRGTDRAICKHLIEHRIAKTVGQHDRTIRDHHTPGGCRIVIAHGAGALQKHIRPTLVPAVALQGRNAPGPGGLQSLNRLVRQHAITVSLWGQLA
uniref:Diguanylate cyclase/phosphodiesterase n=1 Tax=Alcaligenes faecalis TaxID=511 RepID=E7DDI1_ALCFA|nr:diguanylate cyclase/phosphodiesterase [Alcaligenes faecalis]